MKLGHVFIDRTKVKANASTHKAMSYARMGEAEQGLKAEIEALLKQFGSGWTPKAASRSSENSRIQLATSDAAW